MHPYGLQEETWALVRERREEARLARPHTAVAEKREDSEIGNGPSRLTLRAHAPLTPTAHCCR